MIRVAIVEDDRQYREGLDVFFGHAPDFRLVDSFGSGERALEHARRELRLRGELPWDLVAMDLELPGRGGVETTRALKSIAPSVRVVVLTVFESPAVIVEAIAAGADGYLLKRTGAGELLAQLRSVTAGGAPLTAGVARSVLELLRAQVLPGDGVATPSRLALTDREQEVLRCFVRGMSYAGAAEELGIALDTVRHYVRGMYRKLQVHSVAEAVSRAVREGLI